MLFVIKKLKQKQLISVSYLHIAYIPTHSFSEDVQRVSRFLISY